MSQIAVDTDVASYQFNWHSPAQNYVNALHVSELILSFMSVAELRIGAISAGSRWIIGYGEAGGSHLRRPQRPPRHARQQHGALEIVHPVDPCPDRSAPRSLRRQPDRPRCLHHPVHMGAQLVAAVQIRLLRYLAARNSSTPAASAARTSCRSKLASGNRSWIATLR